MQIFLEETQEGLWQQLQSILKQYKVSTEEKRRVYQELMAKDKKGLAEVVENNKKIAKLTVRIIYDYFLSIVLCIYIERG